MEQEPANQSIPEPSKETGQPASPSRQRKFFWIIFIFVISLLIIGGVVVLQFYQPQSEQPANESFSNFVNGSRYYSNIENISFEIPGGWTANFNAAPTLPVDFKDPTIVLQKDTSACTIVGARRKPDAYALRRQISFADRIYSNYHQFDGSWYVASTTETAKYSFSNYERQYLDGEFRVSSGVRNVPLLLLMSDGSSVPDDCNADFNAMLATVEPYYERVNLTSSSQGTLTIEKVWDDVTPIETNKSYEHLVFMADGSQEKREVIRVPDGIWTRRFSVFNNKLYVPTFLTEFNEINNTAKYNSVITVIDPFNAQISQVPGSTTDSYIYSLHLRNGIAYYLASPPLETACWDSYNPCDSDLRAIPISGGQSSLVAHASLAGYILGYVESEDAFYITQGWGDAGLSVQFINKIVNGAEEEVGQFNRYYPGEFGDIADGADNGDYNAQGDEIDAIEAKAGAEKISSSAIHVENHTLQPAGEDESVSTRFYFDK